MATHATITFSQAGVQPPVYVTSSLSGWTPLEMDVAQDKTASGDPIFTKTFTSVDPGSYQYKVRLGQDHWILDESKETATDDQGIRNNVIHVEPASHEPTQSSAPDDTPIQTAASSNPLPALSHDPALKRLDHRKDSTMDQDQLPNASADAGRDTKQAKIDSPIEPNTLKSLHVPLVVVDKVDSTPASTGDATEDATAAQKIAHDVRAPDALPDKVNIVPQHHVESGTNEQQAAPLFRHESSQADQSLLTPSMDTIDEESTPLSADHTSSGDAMDTPSEVDDGDELNLMPLLSHEATGLNHDGNELVNGALFGHEAEPENHHVSEALLFSHESNLPDDTAVTTDSDGGDELDRFPLLAHEGGSSSFKGSKTVTEIDHLDEGPQQYKPNHDEKEPGNYPEGDDGDAPLLPHERKLEIADNEGPDSSHDYASPSLEKQSHFNYETDGARNLFGGPGRYDFFKTRKNSSLPHRLPRSDAEDEDLNDPSLERFPTNRDLILQRVASIGAELPEDESTHEHPHSPQPSVFSQACSSVDLAPVKSYTSLASVPEADDSDEEDDQEEDNHDLDSLPSPIYIGKNFLRVSNPPSGFARDPNATPVINASKQLGDIMQAQDENSGDHAREPGNEAESVSRHDHAKDEPHPASTLRDAISMPTESTTTPVTFNLNATTEAAHPVSDPDSKLRQRRGLAEEPSQKADAPDTTAKDVTTSEEEVASAAPSSAPAQQSDKHDASSLKLLFGVVLGDRKRASVSALVLGGALAAYYYVAAKP